MSGEKTEKPTQKKLDDAKEQGQVVVSRDLARLATLVVIAETAFGTADLWRDALFALFEGSVSGVGKDFATAMQNQVMSALTLLAVVFFACFVLCLVVGVAAHWGQTGIVVSPESLVPKFDKLNPVNGLQQLVSKKKLVELLFTVAKSALIGYLVYGMVRSQLGDIVTLAGGEPRHVWEAVISVMRSIFRVVVTFCLVLGAIDFLVQKHFHVKQLMMDKEEIKREHKEAEGDPRIKQQRKRLAREWANQSAPAKTEKANAVVVNPTHFAVAMFYDAEQPMVPVVLAKGSDEVAQAMIKRAHQYGIPVIRHVWLARVLYATGGDDMPVPRSTYQSVAQVYAVVHELVARGDVQREIELESLGERPSDEPAP